MGTSPETFAQVKDILRKLDRSIDNARSERLQQKDDDANREAGTRRSSEGHAAQPLKAKPLRRPDAATG